ncbi:MAG: cyclic lactone autoinducer peptide [Clostridiales bacterium]|jgi:cyclic lactone autoinducer peptide|nr:cyclic lactone autoinducer peptide [Eubacteriales bacterium]MDH7565984.1 cyclic lactone autoinducer peptide [Clostridiales bacterium]
MKRTILAALSAFAVLFASISSSACAIFIIHQRECPKSLIKVD